MLRANNLQFLKWRGQICRQSARHESKKAEGPPTQKSTATPEAPPTGHSNAGGSNGGGTFLKLLGLSAVGLGGVVAYAAYDPSFRKRVETTVPYSNELFAKVLSPNDELEKSDRDLVPSKMQSVPAVKDLPVEVATEKEVKKVAKAIEKKMEEKIHEEVVNQAEAEKKQRKEAEVKRLLAEEEKAARKANEKLEGSLNDAITAAQSAAQRTLEAYKNAQQAVYQHTAQVRVAMEVSENRKDKSETWSEASAAGEKRVKALKDVEQELLTTRNKIEHVRNELSAGKCNDLTRSNSLLVEVEKQLNDVSYSLEASEADLSKAVAESKVMTEYKDLVVKGREQFKKELDAILPDVKLASKPSDARLDEDEMNSLIAHAHRRIEQLQMQLADQQALETLRTQKALDLQRAEDDKLAQDNVKRELESLKAAFDLEKEQWETTARVAFEKELRYNLARQAAAHSDHLTDVLKQQERELTEKFDVILTDKLILERDRFQTEVAGHIARLRGIEAAVEARADAEEAGRRAQQLWLACQGLQTAITRGHDTGLHDELNKRPLVEDLDAVRDAGETHPFVGQVAQAVPQKAAQEGVWTEEDLVRRFRDVRRVCRRVAMIDEAGGTLFQYFVSYMQSFFVMRARPLRDGEDIAMDNLDTFQLVDNAQYALERGDLEQGLKWTNQLRGEPRRVARDWLVAARQMLEARQAAQALLAHAAASGIGAIN